MAMADGGEIDRDGPGNRGPVDTFDRGVEIGYDLRPVGGYFAIGGKGHPGALEQRAMRG